jgi:hypothetical protein
MKNIAYIFKIIQTFFRNCHNKKIHINMDYYTKDKEQCHEYIGIKTELIDNNNDLYEKLMCQEYLQEIQLY